MKKIAILNYGLGNVRSVGNALRAIGAEANVCHDEHIVMQADGLVIPGVGAFPQAMANLVESGLDKMILKYIDSGRPVFGICLGMQLLFDKSTEFAPTKGLGVIAGSVEIIPVAAGEGRLPHIAWSAICPTEQGRQKVLAGLSDSEMRFYFVHSYAATGVSSDNIVATAPYLGNKIVAAVQSGNVWGTQFHPEKSGPSGLHLLKNFINNC